MKNLISEIDLMIFKELNIKDYSIMELQRKINISPKNIQQHLIKLKEFDFIKIVEANKGHKKKIQITNKGRDILKYFN